MSQAMHVLDDALLMESEPSSVKDFVTLLKPGVLLLVVFTGLTGMWLAPGAGDVHPFIQLVTIVCIAMGSGAGGAINMWFDRDIDAHMLRTANRPVPAGRISADDALAFGVLLAVLSVALLGITTNWLAAGYLAGAIAFYVFIYTVWLKRRTPQNIVIGGAAGAFPPIIGWVAMTGSAAWEPWLLFSIIFMWTPPHFWALALYRCGDYAKVGVPMLPVVAGEEATKRHIWWYTVALVALTLVPCAAGMSGWLYGLAALLLGAKFLQHAWRVGHTTAHAPARAMFGYSILYLFALFAALLLDKIVDISSVLAFL